MAQCFFVMTPLEFPRLRHPCPSLSVTYNFFCTVSSSSSRGRMAHHYVERVVDLTEPQANQLFGLTTDAARQIVFNSPAHEVNRISGSFALVAHCGRTVKMARSLDRPMRYFLAKRQEGPGLLASHRIDAPYN